MTDYRMELLNLLNEYKCNEICGNSDELEVRIRNLACYLSSNDKYKNDKVARLLIFEAAEELRLFGLSNGDLRISPYEFALSDLGMLKRESVNEYYQSVVYSNNKLDRKQKEIVDCFQMLDTKRMLVSAPTSFGKTYILRELIYLNRDRYNNILLIFPTIALLNENTDDVIRLVKDWDVNYKIINNVSNDIKVDDRHIFLLTPERTVKLMSKYKEIKIDFFFFDEVYKIDELLVKDKNGGIRSSRKGDRGSAFRIVLYLLSKKVEEFYLAGPYLKLNSLSDSLKRYVKTNHVRVIDYDFEPTMKIEYESWKKQVIEKHPITDDNKIQKFNEKPRVPDIINLIQDKEWGSTLVYCRSPKSASSAALEYIACMKKVDRELNDLGKLLNHLRNRYDVAGDSVKKWSLYKCLVAGVGIHHGGLPRYIQKEIISLFNRGDLQVLFCTSTIIEGVNTEARNIIVLDSSSGKGKLDSFTLKNIKGRAGRYYHHSVGRVFFMRKDQNDIDKRKTLKLDFLTYSKKELLGVDYDNACLEDLEYENRVIKEARDVQLNKELLPDEVFEENRLFDRKKQEKILESLLEKFSDFEGFYKNNNINWFLKNSCISKVISLFGQIEGSTEGQIKRLISIVQGYSSLGIKGILGYYLKNKNVDDAYNETFKVIREEVEYRFTKYMMVFESLYKRAYFLKKGEEIEYDITPIIRFFEVGVTSEFGAYIIEYGYPAETVREIENNVPELKASTMQEGIRLIRKKWNELERFLDEYEIELLRNVLMEIEAIV